MLHAPWLEYVDGQRSHEQGRVARRNVQHGRPRLQPDVVQRYPFLLCACREKEERTEHLDCISMLLPHLEPPGAELDGECAVGRSFIVQVDVD